MRAASLLSLKSFEKGWESQALAHLAAYFAG
jgi:hypothetical protein